MDTYKPAVARAAIAAGAAIVNDVSGLRDPVLADVCAQTGAALVLMHTRAAPKQKLLDRGLDGRIVADVELFLRERIALALERGVAFEQLMLDPGPDFAKTPAQTVEVLRALPALHALGRPLLLAVSRKDFVGAITGRPPRARLAGTLAAIGARRGGRRAHAPGPRRRRGGRLPRRAGALTGEAEVDSDGCLGLSAGDARRRSTSACPTPQRARFRYGTNRRSLAQRDRSPPIPTRGGS